MRYFKEFELEVDDLFTYLIAHKIKNYWIQYSLENVKDKFKDIHIAIITKYGDINKLIDSELRVYVNTYNVLRIMSGVSGPYFTI